MKILFKTTVYVFCVLLFSSCSEEFSSRDYPRINTLEVSDINENGVTFNGEFIDRGNFDIIRYGFVWAENQYPDVNGSNIISFSGNITTSTFSANATSGLMKGTYYYVRAFVQTKNYLVYGSNVKFQSSGSIPPALYSFTPHEGIWGDTILLKGRNLNYAPALTKVFFGNDQATVVSTCDTAIRVIVPEERYDSSAIIKVNISTFELISEDKFTYLAPIVDRIQSESGTFGDTVYIYGSHFYNDKSTYVKFDYKNADITEIKSNRIKAIVPATLVSKTNNVQVSSCGRVAESSQVFTLLPPEITSAVPMTVTSRDQIITITGKNFNPVLLYNSVTIGSVTATVTQATNTVLKVKLPGTLIPDTTPFYADHIEINLTIAGQSVILTDFVIDIK